MGALEFIFGLIVLFVLFVFGIGALSMKYDTKRLTEENEKLREENKKLRARKSKKIVNEDK